jgi:hypothetical protein
MRQSGRFARWLPARSAGSTLARLLVVVCLPAWGCEHAKGNPAAPTTPAAGGTLPLSATTTGQTIDAVGGGPMGGMTIRVNDSSVTSNGEGQFEIQASGGRQTATISGPGVIVRETGLTIPGPHTVLSLIPASFDLPSFDQMFRRSTRLQRWTTSPSLIIQTRTLLFTSIADTEFVAADGDMSPDQIAELVNDLTAGLYDLSGGTLRFESIEIETAESGSLVAMARSNHIVAARFSGLRRTGYLGFGRWATTPDDAVVAGAVFYDRDFEAIGGSHRRAIRIHELGHALGYHHVTSRTSVMNPVPQVSPTVFDREAAAIAFQRDPGNRSPDVDVSGFSTNLMPGADGRITWHPGLP